jgi:hypothetical protein
MDNVGFRKKPGIAETGLSAHTSARQYFKFLFTCFAHGSRFRFVMIGSAKFARKV